MGPAVISSGISVVGQSGTGLGAHPGYSVARHQRQDLELSVPEILIVTIATP